MADNLEMEKKEEKVSKDVPEKASANVIETKNLLKVFGRKAAVNKISIHVRKGDIYGLIGKNGAGKTTLMKLLLGQSVPTAGKMMLFGSAKLDTGRARVGSLIEEPALYKNCSAYENLKRFGSFTSVSDKEIRDILNMVGLGNVGKKKTGAFSLGMRQRLGLGIALLGHPDILILDEPINGLDPAGIKEIRDIILDLNSRGVTFMISSHLLDELGKIATRYGIINDGFLIEELTAEEMKEQCRQAVRVVTDDAEKAMSLLAAKMPGLTAEADENALTIEGEVNDTSELNRILVTGGVRVYELTDVSIGMEDYFIERLGH